MRTIGTAQSVQQKVKNKSTKEMSFFVTKKERDNRCPETPTSVFWANGDYTNWLIILYENFFH